MKNQSYPHVLATCAIAAVLIISFAGCYTLLKHPRLSDEERSTYEESAVAVNYADDCGSCHESPAYTTVHGYGSPHRSSYDRWRHYYEDPWWVRYYADPQGGEAGDQQQRPYGRRHRGTNDSEPAQTAVSGSDQTPAPSPSVVSKSGNDSTKNDPAPAQKDERREERRSGTESKENRRDRKP